MEKRCCCSCFSDATSLHSLFSRLYCPYSRVKFTAVFLSLQSDYHFEYTQCDVLGSRWRVAIPNKVETCSGLPDPVKGTQCTFTCKEGEYLDMQSQQCQKCAAGTYSLGTGVAFDEWDSLPSGFVSHGVTTNEDSANTNCSNSTWTPQGEYIASNTDECTAALSYAVNLKQPGSLTFEYLYPDSNIYFEFFVCVLKTSCQSVSVQRKWSPVDDRLREELEHIPGTELSNGNNVLYWRTSAFALHNRVVKPVLLRNIQISGVAYTSECFHCKPGTHSAQPGSAHCDPCPPNSYSNKGATVCHECENDQYALAGSGSCKPRPACKNSDYFYTHTPCDAEGKTQLMYKWIAPKICNETADGAVTLPASGNKQSCPPCNPGFFMSNSTCQACPEGHYSNGTDCSECPVGTEPVTEFEYKWWNTMPANMKSSIVESYSLFPLMTAWEVAGDYIYTTPAEQDTDYMTLMLNVPGYRQPHAAAMDTQTEFSRISFVFETVCAADCKLYFLAGSSRWYNDEMEHWTGSAEKQSYSYVILSNRTLSFTWLFQRTEQFNAERKYSADIAKIYSIHITNVMGGVASRCRRCALPSGVETSACVPCPQGHYMVNGTGECRRCPPNTFIRSSYSVGPEACIQCGPNLKPNKAHTACLSDCELDLRAGGGAPPLHYDFSPLSNVTGSHGGPRFTNRGVRYFTHFNVALCGSRTPASCLDNVTESGREVKGYICQSTMVPSGIRSQSLVSSLPFLIGDSLIGVTTETTLDGISSPDRLFPSAPGRPDIIFYYKSSDVTQACKQGRAAAVRLRCNPAVTATDHITLPSTNCSEGTCDGCTFHFLWESQHACPLCTRDHYKPIVSECAQGIQRTTYVWKEHVQCYGGESLPAQTVNACVNLDFWLKFGVLTGAIAALLLILISCYFWKKTRRLEYKYSKLMMSSGDTECKLPAADSCAIMEGEDAEDELMDLTRKSFFTKMKAFSREVSDFTD
uniref:MRH domain-containing protein n=1 Tax=Salarias fasciatus TaxID=181472 RepID=A0A672JED9_SALFA